MYMFLFLFSSLSVLQYLSIVCFYSIRYRYFRRQAQPFNFVFYLLVFFFIILFYSYRARGSSALSGNKTSRRFSPRVSSCHGWSTLFDNIDTVTLSILTFFSSSSFIFMFFAELRASWAHSIFIGLKAHSSVRTLSASDTLLYQFRKLPRRYFSDNINLRSDYKWRPK